MLDLYCNQRPAQSTLEESHRDCGKGGRDHVVSSNDIPLLITAKIRRRRFVKFHVDDKNRIKKDVKTYDQYSNHYDKDLYLSKSEKGKISKHARKEAEKLRTLDPALKSQIIEAYDNCDHSELPREQNIIDIQAMATWSNSEGRGLEHGVFREMRVGQRRAVRQTVQYYRSNKEKLGVVSDEDVRLFCECRTFRSREFAVKMAIADVLTL